MKIFENGIDIRFPEFPWKKKEPSKPSLIKDMVKNPDDFVLIASVEGDELIVKFRKKKFE